MDLLFSEKENIIDRFHSTVRAFVTVEELAKLLDLSPRRIQQLVQEEVIPAPIKDRYDLRGCVTTYVQYLRRLTTTNGSLSLAEERARLTRHQADIASLDLKQKQGAMIPVNVALQAWSERVTSAKTKLLAIPAKAAALVLACGSPAEAQGVLSTLIREVMDDIARPVEGPSNGTVRRNSKRGLATLRTTPRDHGQSVG